MIYARTESGVYDYDAGKKIVDADGVERIEVRSSEGDRYTVRYEKVLSKTEYDLRLSDSEASESEKSDRRFVIRIEPNSTLEGQESRYLSHAIPFGHDGHMLVSLGRKSEAKSFDSEGEAWRFLERSKLPKGRFEVEEAGRFIELPGLIAECPGDGRKDT